MKFFFVERSCWPVHAPSLAGGVDHNMDGANLAVFPAQTKTAFLSGERGWRCVLAQKGGFGV